MRMQARSIILGTHRWQVRPLTIDQVQAIEPILFDQEKSGSVAAAVAILRVALARDHAEASADLESIEAGAPEIAEAMADVLRLGGFLPNQEGSRLGGAEAG